MQDDIYVYIYINGGGENGLGLVEKRVSLFSLTVPEFRGDFKLRDLLRRPNW